MKTTNTRKNRGKKSRDFKNTQKGGRRNKVVYMKKKSLRGKKKYTRRNRWKKNIHRGRQFLDVIVGGAQRTDEPVKISENMVIYTLSNLKDEKQLMSNLENEYFTIYKFDEIKLVIFFFIKFKSIRQANFVGLIQEKFRKLENHYLNSLYDDDDCIDFPQLEKEIEKYNLFIYSFGNKNIDFVSKISSDYIKSGVESYEDLISTSTDNKLQLVLDYMKNTKKQSTEQLDRYLFKLQPTPIKIYPNKDIENSYTTFINSITADLVSDSQFENNILVNYPTDRKFIITPDLTLLNFFLELDSENRKKIDLTEQRKYGDNSMKEVFFKNIIQFKNTENFSKSVIEVKELDVIALKIKNQYQAMKEIEINNFKKMNYYFYNFSCLEKKYFCTPILLGKLSDDAKSTIMINEYGGENIIDFFDELDVIRNLKDNRYPKKEIKSLASISLQQLFKICKIFTKNRLIHCDIKLDNILYNSVYKQIKIIDFGHLISYEKFESAYYKTGTLGYVLSDIFKITKIEGESDIFYNKILSKYDLFTSFIIIENLYIKQLSKKKSTTLELNSYDVTYPNLQAFLYNYVKQNLYKNYFTLVNEENKKKNQGFLDNLAIQLTILYLFPTVDEILNIFIAKKSFLQRRGNKTNYFEKLQELIKDKLINFEQQYNIIRVNLTYLNVQDNDVQLVNLEDDTSNVEININSIESKPE